MSTDKPPGMRPIFVLAFAVMVAAALAIAAQSVMHR